VVAFYFGAQAYEAVGMAKARAGGDGVTGQSSAGGVTTRGGGGTTRSGDAAKAPSAAREQAVEIYD
jgi:hypothetical protein